MFWSIACVMALVALALVLRPLVRGGASRDARLDALERARRDGVLSDAEFAAKRDALGAEFPPPPPVPKPLVAALALALLAGSVGLYQFVGEPRAIGPGLATSTTAPPMEEAIPALVARLEREPEDLEGWLLLGRAYKQTQRFAEARDALANAIRISPDSTDAMVEYAESLALAAPDRRLGDESRALLGKALALEPEHQRGLWLSGIASLQDERYEDAVAVWDRLLAQLPPDSDVAESVREQIAQARARGGMPALAERVASPPENAETSAPTPIAGAEAPIDAAPADAGPRLVIEIALAPALAARIEPGDTLFVFARAPQGPKMPLAIQRIPVPSFPTTIVLDDSMGMMPALKLSQAAEVVVGARISKSGTAAAQRGDLEVISAPLTVATQRAPVKLVIDRVVP
ncbi:MAG TPA: tetratricopeptide repeat protein [Candidatus Saccharimonadia bacterium]|nr:tetratricopeptide repeat protein [Candidatus Saccharimonadia bacterium]